jgi:AcrR family transcriptional regulator
MTLQERRAREKQELRQQILDAARDLLAQDGYENFSMRKLAEKIEYSPTTIYLYFESKADLVSRLCEETFGVLVKQLEAIASLASEPVEGLRAAMLAYVEFGLKHPADYHVAFVLAASTIGPETQKLLSPSSKAMLSYDCLRRGVDKCIRTGSFRRRDLDRTAQAIWAGMHGITSLLIAHPSFAWAGKDLLVDELIEMLIDGSRA